MKKEYYIISLKHTSIGDTALTLWGENHNGYTWHKDRAGIYHEEDKQGTESNQNVFVDKEAADRFWLPGNDYGDKFIALPNDTTVRTLLKLDAKQMKPKKLKGCQIVFHL